MEIIDRRIIYLFNTSITTALVAWNVILNFWAQIRLIFVSFLHRL